MQRLKKRSLRKEWNPTDPVHEEWWKAKNIYANEIRAAKVDCWKKGLEEEVSRGIDMWKGYVEGKEDGRVTIWGRGTGQDAREMKDERSRGVTSYACDNATKSEILYRKFLPEPPEESYVPPTDEYPAAKWKTRVITDGHVERVFRGMKANKATRDGTLHNNVMRNTANIIAPYVGPIYRAKYNLEVYPENWKLFATPVIRKPGKGDYKKPGAHRPVNLSHGLARGINACVKNNILYELEQRNLLPEHRFGGRPGRTGIDAILMLATKVKEAWRGGKVATALSLDVKGAFPSTDLKMLFHDMRMMGVPKEDVEWLEGRMEGRSIQFDDFKSDFFKV